MYVALLSVVDEPGTILKCVAVMLFPWSAGVCVRVTRADVRERLLFFFPLQRL